MTARTSLRQYQRELVERLRGAQASATPFKLGVQLGEGRWLVDLAEAGEVLPVPPLAPLPLTRPWFRGLANVRGNLYAVSDFSAFMGGEPVIATPEARLLILGERFRLEAGILVHRSLGLRNAAQLQAVDEEPGPWARATFTEADGTRWKELDLEQLAGQTDFLAIGA